jgi:hypothetical protein
MDASIAQDSAAQDAVGSTEASTPDAAMDAGNVETSKYFR